MSRFWAKYGATITLIILIVVLSIAGGMAGSSIEKLASAEEVEVVKVDYKLNKDATVIIIGFGMTSGTVITPDGYVLGCAHGGVAQYAYAVQYYDDMDMPLILKMEVDTVYLNKEIDLGIFKISDPRNPDRVWDYVPVGMADLEVSEDVFSVGTPLGRPFYISWGKMIQDAYRGDTGEGYWLHSCSTNMGNSGGGLFNMRGELVGVNVFMFAALPTMAGYIALVDGCYAVMINDFMPAIWGIIEVHRNLQENKVDFVAAQKHLNDLRRSKPD